MLTLPLALIGVFLIFWLTGTNFDRSAYIGVVLLMGVVVNNAILMVARISRLQMEGKPVQEAIFLGATHRVRPILTTLMTVFGLLPLVLSGGESRLWGTLALSTIWRAHNLCILRSAGHACAISLICPETEPTYYFVSQIR